MGAVEQSSANVEAYLSALEESYSSFPVNQVTFSVSPDQYERYLDDAGAGYVDAYAKIRNDEEQILHVTGESEPHLPTVTTASATSLESELRDSVETRHDITWQVEGIDQTTIVGMRNADAPEQETVYRLAVVFVGTLETGTAEGDVAWEPALETIQTVYN